MKERESGGTVRLCSFVIKAKDADVIGDEPILHNGRVVGWVTSGGYAHGAGKSMAQGYVPKDIANDDSGWSIELLGKIWPPNARNFHYLIPMPTACGADFAVKKDQYIIGTLG